MIFKKMFGKKDRTANKQYFDLVRESVQKLCEGDKSRIRVVYSALAYGDSALTRMAGRAIRSHLDTYSRKQMLELSKTFRQYTSMEWTIDWKNISIKKIRSDFENENDYIYALILGSFHPNGHFREKCIIELAEYPDTLFYIALRANDWVEQIRKRAMDLMYIKIKNCSINEILQATPSFDKLLISERRDTHELNEIYEKFALRIENEIYKIQIDDILNYDFETRKNIYKLVFSKKMLDIEKAEHLLKNEKQSYCRGIIISGILESYNCSMQQIDFYLKSEDILVKRKSLEYKYLILADVWPGLEDQLLDKSSRIREYAVWILQRHSQFNVLDFYINQMDGRNLKSAITGIGETGNKEHAKMLMPYLESAQQKIVRTTILALGRLIGSDGDDLYWRYLLDERIGISKAAYISIRKNSIRYGIKKLYAEYLANSKYNVRRYLIMLIMQEDSWERLPYLVDLYGKADLAELQDRILTKIKQRNVYSKVTAEQVELINKTLAEKEGALPADVIEDIKFDIKHINIIKEHINIIKVIS